MKKTANATVANATAREMMLELHTHKAWNDAISALYRDFHEALMALRNDYESNPDLYKKTLKSPKDLKEDLSEDPAVSNDFWDDNFEIPRLWNLVQAALSPDEFERIRLGYFYVLDVTEDRVLDNRWTAAEKALIMKNLEWLNFYLKTLDSLEDIADRLFNAYLLTVSVGFASTSVD